MMRLAHFLDGLRCSCCGALNVLWLDPVRGILECHECGQKAAVLVDGPDPADTPDSFDDLDLINAPSSLDSFDWCGGDR
ncbi:hypothetical protein TBS_21490 [Thermobispora bispora]|jgi:hypothetical protein|uniref:hypothetical protein n=1 Tax=Thermobispora bispora TaxID=2006 RepID=UPI00197FB327|nr:hypothetical protein [Thermobispora bispora]QSI47039.1 hypothetical protein CYL17_03575 [Thermobispora bispora]